MNDIIDEEIFWDRYCRKSVLDASDDAQKNIERSSDDDFWRHFLSGQTFFVVIIHGVNICSLFLLMIVIVLSKHSHISMSVTSLDCLVVDIFVWALVSILILMVLLVTYGRSDRAVRSIFAQNPDEVWANIGSFVLMLRLFCMISRLVRWMEKDATCALIEGLSAQDKSTTIPLFRYLIDNGQLLLFSIVPFPAPWAICFCALEGLNQLFRMSTCLPDFMHRFRYMKPLIFFTQCFYCFSVWLGTSKFVLAAKSIHHSLSQQERLLARKVRFVDWLSNELKITLQKLVISTDTKAIFDQALTIQSYVPDQEKNEIKFWTKFVNLLVEDLLFLIRIEEGRLGMDGLHSFNAPTFIGNLVDTSTHRNLRKTLVLDITEKTFYTELICFSLLFRNILHIGSVMLNAWKRSNRHKPALSSEKALMLSVTYLLDDTFPSNSPGAILRINLRCYGLLASDHQGKQTDVTVPELILLTCESLCRLFGGSFRFAPGGVEATWRCQLVKVERSRTAPDHSYKWWREGLANIGSGITGSYFLRSRPRVVVVAPTDQSSLVIAPVVSAVQQLKRADTSYFRTWQELDLSLFSSDLSDIDIVLLIHPTDVLTLRKLNFMNQIVLFSGGIGYLEQQIKQSSDYLLPIPCLEDDVALFDQWLQARVSSGSSGGAGMSKPARFSSSAIGNFDKPLESRASSAGSRGFQVQTLSSRFDFAHSMLGMPQFKTLEIEETFNKWRLLNPLPMTSYWRHQTSFTDVAVLLVFINFGGTGLLGLSDCPLDSSAHPYASKFYLATASFYFIAVTIRTFVFNHILKKLNCRFRSYMLFFGSIYILNIVFGCLQVFFRAENGAYAFHMPSIDRHASLAQLESQAYGSYSWFGAVWTLIRWQASVPIEYALFLPWPIGMIANVLNKIRIQMLLLFIIRNAIDDSYFMVGETIFLILLLLTICIYYHFEWFHREEFRLFRKSQANYDYVDRCVQLCKQDLALPLQKIFATRARIEASLCTSLCGQSDSDWRASLTRVVEINRLREGFLLLRLLLNELEFNDSVLELDSQFDTTRTSAALGETDVLGGGTEGLGGGGGGIGKLVYSFEPRSLRDEMLRMVSALTASTGLLFQVFLRMDAELAFVKIDVKVLATIFVNAFLLCVKNIARRLAQRPRSKDLQQRVMILVRYDEEAAKSKYAAGSVCLMQIEFYDTGLSLVADQTSFGYLVCRDLVMQASRQKGDCICVAGPVTQEQYTCGQVITVPYQIHPASKSAAAIYEKLHSGGMELICDTDDDAVSKKTEAACPMPRMGHRAIHGKSLLLVFPQDMNFKIDSFLIHVFEMHGWSCQTNSGVEIFFKDKRYHDVDCILFVQSSFVGGKMAADPALPCDVNTVQRLRLSGFKMIVACLLNCAPSRRMEQKYRGVLDLLLDKPVIDPKMDALATACTRRRTELFLDMQPHQP